MRFSDDREFERIAEYREIGGWTEDGDIPLDVYLRDGVPDEPAAVPVEDAPGRSPAGW